MHNPQFYVSGKRPIPGPCATCNFTYLVRGPLWNVYKDPENTYQSPHSPRVHVNFKRLFHIHIYIFKIMCSIVNMNARNLGDVTIVERQENCIIRWNREQSHKSHNAPVPYPTIYHSVKKCAYFCSKFHFNSLFGHLVPYKHQRQVLPNILEIIHVATLVRAHTHAHTHTQIHAHIHTHDCFRHSSRNRHHSMYM